MKIYDISMPLSEEINVFPGDPEFKAAYNCKMSEGAPADVGFVQMSLHTGTHAEAPGHIFPEGRNMDDIPLEYWIGPAYVADMTDVAKCISEKDIENIGTKIKANNVKRLLLKTRKPKGGNYIYLNESACDAIVKSGIITLGISSMSVDLPDNAELAAHKKLFANNICIIENLILHKIIEGYYYMVCLPLKIKKFEAAPARVILTKTVKTNIGKTDKTRLNQ